MLIERFDANYKALLRSKIAYFLGWATIAFAGAALVGFAHEMGHFVFGYIFNWNPVISFSNGGRVSYSSQPIAVAPWQEFVALMGGPLITFFFAFLFARQLAKWPLSRFLLILALWNSVFRLSVIIDGKGSDEAKMSSIVGISYSFQTLSVIASLILSGFIIQRQRLLPRHYWMIPIAFLVFALCYISSLRLMSLTIG